MYLRYKWPDWFPYIPEWVKEERRRWQYDSDGETRAAITDLIASGRLKITEHDDKEDEQ